jgi:hypothetical protein
VAESSASGSATCAAARFAWLDSFRTVPAFGRFLVGLMGSVR